MGFKTISQTMTDNDILEEIDLKSVPNKNNFYFFPDDNRLAASRVGEILNVKTGKYLKPIFNKSNRATIIITSPGIKPKAYKYSRILARTFIGRPKRLVNIKFKKLEVNHKDGNTRNNKIDNLEWVTSKENILHSNRILGNRTNTKAVLVKSLINGNTNKFNTLAECAEYFNINKATLWKHLTSGNSGRYKKDNCIFKFDDGTEWNTYHPKLIGNLTDSNKTIKCLITDAAEKTIYIGTKSEAYKILNMSRKKFNKKFKNKDFATYDNYFIFFC